jgi:hypothetical protein
MSKTSIVCPKCGALYQVAAQRGREILRGAAKPVPEAEANDSEAEPVFVEEMDEGEDKVVAVAMDDLDVEAEPDDTLLPGEEEEMTGDL